MNSSADRVIKTCTEKPRSIKARANSAALYAAMPPPTPRATFFVIAVVIAAVLANAQAYSSGGV